MKKTDIIEKAKEDLVNSVQCQMICSDGSGKSVKVHFMGCSFYRGYECQKKQSKSDHFCPCCDCNGDGLKNKYKKKIKSKYQGQRFEGRL